MDSEASHTPHLRELIVGIGDDCAIFEPRPNEDLLFKTDPLIEGIHFTNAMPAGASRCPSPCAQSQRYRRNGR